jgi:hypothetical protein
LYIVLLCRFNSNEGTGADVYEERKNTEVTKAAFDEEPNTNIKKVPDTAVDEEPTSKEVRDFAVDKESDSKDVPGVDVELFARKYLTQFVDEDHNAQEVMALLLPRNYTVPNIKFMYSRQRNWAASVPIPTCVCL